MPRSNRPHKYGEPWMTLLSSMMLDKRNEYTVMLPKGEAQKHRQNFYSFAKANHIEAARLTKEGDIRQAQIYKGYALTLDKYIARITTDVGLPSGMVNLCFVHRDTDPTNKSFREQIESQLDGATTDIESPSDIQVLDDTADQGTDPDPTKELLGDFLQGDPKLWKKLTDDPEEDSDTEEKSDDKRTRTEASDFGF